MPTRHPVPRLWLMTDERMGDTLWAALDRLPRGSGVVFRHYGLASSARRALFARVRQVARRRRLILVRAGRMRLRGEMGVHGQRSGTGLRSWAVHSRRQSVSARRAGAHLVFVSPVFPTRSHPGARTLGIVRLGLLIREVKVPAIALGGMNANGARSLTPLGVHGWAAVDAWSRPAK